MAEDKGISLVEFARKRRQADCPVCLLPDEIRRQMAVASSKKIQRGVVLAWLVEAHGLTIMPADMTTHLNGHHDSWT